MGTRSYHSVVTVRLTFPVRYRARLTAGFDIAGMLGVEYWGLDAYAIALRAPFPPSEDLNLIAPDAPSGAGTAGPRVLITGSKESLLVDYDGLELWSRDYVLPFLSIDWNDEDSRAASAGAIAVVGFRRMSREDRAHGSSGGQPEGR